jgi:hypothetical protein
MFLYITPSDASPDHREREFQNFVSELGAFMRDNAKGLVGGSSDIDETSNDGGKSSGEKTRRGFNPLNRADKPTKEQNNPDVPGKISDVDWG